MRDRAGMLAEAAGMVMPMPMRLDSYVLLCRVVERLPGAHSVGRRVVKVDGAARSGSCVHIQLSNMYAGRLRQVRVVRVRTSMEEKKVNTVPGRPGAAWQGRRRRSSRRPMA